MEHTLAIKQLQLEIKHFIKMIKYNKMCIKNIKSWKYNPHTSNNKAIEEIAKYEKELKELPKKIDSLKNSINFLKKI